jgi:hypothetical protein
MHLVRLAAPCVDNNVLRDSEADSRAPLTMNHGGAHVRHDVALVHHAKRFSHRALRIENLSSQKM